MSGLRKRRTELLGLQVVLLLAAILRAQAQGIEAQLSRLIVILWGTTSVFRVCSRQHQATCPPGRRGNKGVCMSLCGRQLQHDVAECRTTQHAANSASSDCGLQRKRSGHPAIMVQDSTW